MTTPAITSGGGLQNALNGMADAVTAAINAYGVTAPGQVGLGFPFGITLAELMQAIAPPTTSNPGGPFNWQASVAPYGKGRDATRYRPLWEATGPLSTLALTAAVDGDQVTFGGTAQSGCNVVIFYTALAGEWNEPAVYQTGPNDTLDTIAAGAAAAINSFATPGVTGTATGPVLNVTGIPSALVVNIGQTGLEAIEVGRRAQDLIVSLWCPNPDIRFTLHEAVESQIGTAITPFIELPDGTQMRVVHVQDWWKETSQLSYPLYEAHFVFDCEYPIVLTTPGVTIEAPAVTIDLGGAAFPPLYGDGR
jgi:hypothetical protein